MEESNTKMYSENIFKIILKIRNNSAANLKSTLRVLQEKQIGTKEQVLVRLAKKLATDKGQNMARRAFKPEIYREIYEVDLFKDFDTNNEVYMFYRSLVPENIRTSEKLASINHYTTETQGVSNIIEINDEMQSKPIKSNPLTLENILSSIDQQRCVLDAQDCENERLCYCDPMKVAMEQKTKRINCKTCSYPIHHECLEANQKMKQSRVGSKMEFNCDHCQFMALDPLAIPVATILSPYKIAKIRNDIAKQQILGGYISSCEQQFYFKPELFRLIKRNDESLRVQVRCLRLDGIGFEHCFPKYGFLQVNNAACQREFKIPDPPNHEKKRKDQILDITKICKAEKNFINIFQTQKNHKNNYSDHSGHVVGIYLVKEIEADKMVKHVEKHNIEDAKLSLVRFKQFFNDKYCLDKDIEMIDSQQADRAILTLTDPMTMQLIDIPVRGNICQHLTCFDLQTYVTMNNQSKRWQCPHCNKRCASLKVDSFFKLLLQARKALNNEDTQGEIDNKVTVHRDLSITFTTNKGKTPLKTLFADIKDQVCVRFNEEVVEDKNMQEEEKGDNLSKFDEQKTNVITPIQPSQKKSILGKRKHMGDPLENYLVPTPSSQASKESWSNMSEPIEIE